MYKLLIVDDEEQIRKGLMQIIRWGDYGIEVCGEAGDGKEALEIMKREHPRIILTDVKMPGMDGIELCREVRLQFPECRTIVLSGYDDFGLVREALRNGAADYLLKPCVREELVRALQEVIDAVEDVILSRLKNTERMNLLKNNILNRLLTGTISSREWKEKRELAGLEQPGKNTTAVVLKIERKEGSGGDGAWAVFAVWNICEEVFRGRAAAVFTDMQGNIIVLYKNSEETACDQDLKPLLERCIRTSGRLLGLSVSAGIGSRADSARNLSRSYRDAETALAYRYVFGPEKILSFEEITAYFKTGEALCLLRETAYRQFEEAYECAQEEGVISRDSLRAEKAGVLAELMKGGGTEKAAAVLLEAAGKIADRIREGRRVKYSKPVADTLEIIRKEFRDPELSLANVSERFHFSSAYLGRLFKKETDQNFSDYLNAVRIEYAKKLLEETNYKGVELSSMSGFASYNYFYIVFKKLNGVSPMEYRRN